MIPCPLGDSTEAGPLSQRHLPCHSCTFVRPVAALAALLLAVGPDGVRKTIGQPARRKS